MIVILMGMSAVGKDSVRRVLERDYGYSNIVSYTSRGMRVGEEDGIDYHFVSKKEFEDMIKNNDMIEYRSYETKLGGVNDTWFYGIKKFELDDSKDYVVVIDLVGAENIINYFGVENCIVVYLDVSEKVREIRARNRGSFDEIEWERRLIADYKDFSFVNLQAFKDKHQIWEISNELRGDKALSEIASVVDFIVQGRLY